jgi:hypothetical protein
MVAKNVSKVSLANIGARSLEPNHRQRRFGNHLMEVYGCLGEDAEIDPGLHKRLSACDLLSVSFSGL